MATLQTSNRWGSFVNIDIVYNSDFQNLKDCIETLTVTEAGYPFTITIMNSDPDIEPYLIDLKKQGTIKNLALISKNVSEFQKSNLAWSLEPNAGYYLRLDSRVKITTQGWLKKMVSIAESFPQIGIVAYNFENKFYSIITVNGYDLCYLDSVQEGCLLISRKINKTYGFFCDSEDLVDPIKDFCLRLNLSGLHVAYLPDKMIPLEKIHQNKSDISYVDQYRKMTRSLYYDSPFISSQKSITDQLFDCSIIIPVYDKVEYTEKCIKAIIMNTNPHINYEIIVVDNGSTDGTRQFLKGLLGNVQVLNNTTNLGFAKACNQGVALARARYLVFLNNDTIPFPGWLEPLFEGIEKDGADIVGAKLIYPWGRIQHAGVAFNNDDIGFHLFRRMPYNSKEVDKKRWVQCVTGACMFMKKETFIELGGFCEEYINGVEDVDFCLTAVSKGKKILYNNESLIVHYEETSVGRKKYDQQNLEKFFTRWKNKIDRDGHRICFSENLNFIN